MMRLPGAGTGARGLLACAPPKAGELCWRRLAALLRRFSQTWSEITQIQTEDITSSVISVQISIRQSHARIQLFSLTCSFAQVSFGVFFFLFCFRPEKKRMLKKTMTDYLSVKFPLVWKLTGQTCLPLIVLHHLQSMHSLALRDLLMFTQVYQSLCTLEEVKTKTSYSLQQSD